MKQSILLLLLGLSSTFLYSKEPVNWKQKKKNPGPVVQANCAPATAFQYLEFNNVRALMENSGRMWQDAATGASYEVPIGSGKTSLFAGALWMGGMDVNGQLKLAAASFGGVGNDYWPGPLNVSTAEIDPATCLKWDKFFKITVDEVKAFVAFKTTGEPVDYQTPNSILDYPAHGNTSKGQDYYLAPFIDVNGDGIYDPRNSGDYPAYDIQGKADCKKGLFGDETYWWIFNDKGNIHSSSQGPSIGMEIHAQAFAFATNDEINDMTFYNYELINRSTFTLTETYFGQWVDPDLGHADDDYVGCDVERGLGYCYNGNAIDGTGDVHHYGAQPPAIGVDFFQGPYQDKDGIDNQYLENISNAIQQKGIPYKGLGIGYSDSLADNERFGMRKFVYYNNDFSVTGNPEDALDYYNYLRGVWKDGTPMTYGADGHSGTVLCDYMFPGDSDPLDWGTRGVSAPSNWTEETAGNTPRDRRFIQSAGPFVLEPGAVNDITVGVVYARAASGGPYASVQKLRVADDKAQALFDNCFKVLNGPDAPVLTIQELENSLVLYIQNPKVSNNYNEAYEESDPFIVTPDSLLALGLPYDNVYRFQGYQIYQVASADVSANELYDLDKARLVTQIDKKDSIGQLVNFIYDDKLKANIPQEMVAGANKGLSHSFVVRNDLFATGDRKLVNHKTYYYIAVAYAHNNYKSYNQLDPLALDGQKKPYLGSRKAPIGAIRSVSGIPHIHSPEAGGTIANSSYGDSPQITRKEGTGNGGLNLRITEASEAEILKAPYQINFPVYEAGFGPVEVKVIDPLNVPSGDFTIYFRDTTANSVNDFYWVLVQDATEDSVVSDQAIELGDEKLILEWGISVKVEDVLNPGLEPEDNNGFITAEIVYKDSTKKWLSGISDIDGSTDWNWIRAGKTDNPDTEPSNNYDDYAGVDDLQNYEKVLEGQWSPYGLSASPPATLIGNVEVRHAPGFHALSVENATLNKLKSVDIVFTDDKSKWTRCPVIELQDDPNLAIGKVEKGYLRASNSVDQNGQPDGTGTGYGWFPGYALELETGKRLNMAFGEDSWMGGENGSDMIWNPTSTETAGVTQDIRWGGKHYLYVFRSDTLAASTHVDYFTSYDQGSFWDIKLAANSALPLDKRMERLWQNCMWVGIPMLAEGQKLLSNEARIRLRVKRNYEMQYTTSVKNEDKPMYSFNLDNLASVVSDQLTAQEALALINVVPNPYYGFSEYEANQYDNVIKITDLPEVCSVTIYNIGGTLVRQYSKGDPSTSLNWNLQNSKGVPVASGIYLIHVNVPGVGEKILKSFLVQRQLDASNF